MHGIGCEQAAFEAKAFDQRLRRRDLVAFVVGREMAEDHRLILSKSAQHMGGLPVMEAIEATSKCLAVNRDGGRHPVVRPRWHEGRGVGPKRLLDCQGIEPMQDGAYRTVGRRLSPTKTERLVQPRKMTVDKTMDLAVGGCPRQHRKNADHEDWSQTVHLALRPAWVGDGGRRGDTASQLSR